MKQKIQETASFVREGYYSFEEKKKKAVKLAQLPAIPFSTKPHFIACLEIQIIKTKNKLIFLFPLSLTRGDF